MSIVPIESCGDSSVQFQFAKTSFDQVPLSVELLVVPDPALPVALGRDDGLHFPLLKPTTNLVGIVALVRNQALGTLVLQQRGCTLTIGLFSSGEQQPQGPSQPVAQQMNLSRQSSSGSPQSLVGRPLFPAAACWWALTREESIIT